MRATLCTLAGITIFLCSSLALACGFETPYYYDVPEFAYPHAFFFGGSAVGSGTVLDESQSEVPGTVEWSDSRFVFIFTPDSPMEVGARYEWTEEGAEGTGSFTVIADDTEPDVSFEIVETKLVESEPASTCCLIVDEQSDFCGLTDSVCWPAEYQYQPNVTVEFDTNVPVKATVIIDTADGEYEGFERSFLSDPTVTVQLKGPLGDQDICIHVIVVEPGSGMELLNDRRCVPPDEFDSPAEMRVPDAPDEVAMCRHPPKNQQDPNWVKYRDNAELSEEGEALVEPEPDSGGCSHSGNSTGALSPLALLGLFVFRRRRKWAAHNQPKSPVT